ARFQRNVHGDAIDAGHGRDDEDVIADSDGTVTAAITLEFHRFIFHFSCNADASAAARILRTRRREAPGFQATAIVHMHMFSLANIADGEPDDLTVLPYFGIHRDAHKGNLVTSRDPVPCDKLRTIAHTGHKNRLPRLDIGCRRCDVIRIADLDGGLSADPVGSAGVHGCGDSSPVEAILRPKSRGTASMRLLV